MSGKFWGRIVSVADLEHYSKNELVAELINRQTFVGLVIYHRGDAKDGRLDPAEIVLTTSPPLSRDGVISLLQIGHSLVPGMFGDESPAAAVGLPLDASRPPLRVDDGGVVRVGATRVSLDVVVEQYENGMSPEEMVRAYDALALDEVYGAIAYYLRHRIDVQGYLTRRQEEASALQAKIESEHSPITHQELLGRSHTESSAHAPTRQ